MCGPTAVLAFFFARAWDRFKGAAWRTAIQAGLVPISVGLVGASSIVLARSADHNWIAVAITAASAATAYWTRWNPLFVFAAAALLGLIGLV
jgi:chromate transporter